MSARQTVEDQVTRLKSLALKLPQSVKQASKDGCIMTAFTSISGPKEDDEHWPVFNRRMDVLFGEDQRDKDGRLLHFERGPFGMDMVVSYIEEAVKAGHLLWEAATPKLDRLISESEYFIAAAGTTTTGIKPKVMLKLPVDPKGKKKVSESCATAVSDSDNDATFEPSKRRRADSDSPENHPTHVFGTDGEEIIDFTEMGRTLEERRKRKRTQQAAGNSTAGVTVANPKRKPKPKPKPKGDASEPMNVDSTDESDGQSALREIEVRDQGLGARRGPQNSSLQHFYDPVPVVDKNRSSRWEFKCKYCRCIRSVPRTVNGNKTFDDEPKLPKLNNLASHITDCKKIDDVPSSDNPPSTQWNIKQSAELMAQYLKAGELNPEVIPTQKGFLRLFSAWILDESLPWTTGQAPSLNLLFKYLKVRFYLPSDTTVRNQLSKIFLELHGKIVREFTNTKSKIAYATDTWTTRQMVYTFACTIGSFINDDWKLVQHVVDFAVLDDKEHEGIYAGQAFVNGIRKRGGLDKICLSYSSHVTTDNASVNDVIVRVAGQIILSKYGTPYTPDMHIRCIAHVVNLVVQAILAGLDEADDPDKVDYFTLHKGSPIHYDIDADENQATLESEPMDVEADEACEVEEVNNLDAAEKEMVENVEASTPLKRLRFLANKIVSSPQRRAKFRKIAREKYSSNPDTVNRVKLMVVRDVRTRWNYTHAMIRRALLLQEAINSWVFESAELQGCIFTRSDWARLEQLADILEVFTQVTLQMSQESQPTIPLVLPMYEKMERHLLQVSTNDKYRGQLQRAVRAGHEKLQKYKAFADKNQFYTISTVLHPYLRAEWFKNTATQSTSDTYKDTHRAAAERAAVERAETLFIYVAQQYDNLPPLNGVELAAPSLAGGTAAGSWLSDVCDFDIAVLPAEQSKDRLQEEIRRYLKFEGGRGDLANPLSWYKKNGSSFPIIARMARDFLAIPATSVSVERVFSKSRHVCSDLRSSLKAETISEALLSKVWIREGLLDVNEPLPVRKKHGLS